MIGYRLHNFYKYWTIRRVHAVGDQRNSYMIPSNWVVITLKEAERLREESR